MLIDWTCQLRTRCLDWRGEEEEEEVKEGDADGGGGTGRTRVGGRRIRKDFNFLVLCRSLNGELGITD